MLFPSKFDAVLTAIANRRYRTPEELGTLFEDLQVEAGVEYLCPAGGNQVDQTIRHIFFNLPALHNAGQFRTFVAHAYQELREEENDPRRVVELILSAPLRFLPPPPLEERAPRRRARPPEAAPAA